MFELRLVVLDSSINEVDGLGEGGMHLESQLPCALYPFIQVTSFWDGWIELKEGRCCWPWLFATGYSLRVAEGVRDLHIFAS
jgi:hypothetical protein